MSRNASSCCEPKEGSGVSGRPFHEESELLKRLSQKGFEASEGVGCDIPEGEGFEVSKRLSQEASGALSQEGFKNPERLSQEVSGVLSPEGFEVSDRLSQEESEGFSHKDFEVSGRPSQEGFRVLRSSSCSSCL
jgi:hypothetical protein